MEGTRVVQNSYNLCTLSDGSLLLRARAPKVIEIDVEPIVDLFVEFVITIANLLRADTLLPCFSFYTDT